MKKEVRNRLSRTAASGTIALVFLVLGFQIAVFVIKVVERPALVRDTPPAPAGPAPDDLPAVPSPETGRTPLETGRAAAGRSPRTALGGYARPASRPAARPRHYESFPFDPNTVSLPDLVRLGLSERQAETIENYRSKGGRFRSKADFRKMYVVSDSLYTRLEPYIEIPKLELNTADSAALVSLRGIGPYYAHKILEYRGRLGGFCDRAQLLEVEGVDAERYAGFADEITVDTAKIRRLDLWHAPDSVLARHPYLGARGARSVVRFRQLFDSTRWTLADLAKEQVLSQENIENLKKYIVNQ